MRTEHKRPLVAFIVVALFCSFTVGNAVRSALQGNGFNLTILIPMAPPNLLRTIEASGSNGRYLDTPFLGAAISAVSDTPAPAEPRELSRAAGGAPAATAAPGVVVPVVAQSHRSTGRQPGSRPHTTTFHPRPPRNIGNPPPVSTGPTTLQVAAEDLRQARAYALKAKRAAQLATRDARACVRAIGSAACQDLTAAAQAARIRADSAVTEMGHLRNVVDHLQTEINTLVAPVRAKATATFRTRVDKAQNQLATIQATVRSSTQAFTATWREEWSDATRAYSAAVDDARSASHKASEQRLRQVSAYAKRRQATVRHIQDVYEKKVRSGHVAEARAYRKRALAAVATTDREFNAKISAERDLASAAYETSLGVARDALERTRAEVARAKEKQAARAAALVALAADRYQTKVQTEAEVRAQTIAEAVAQAEATVVVDPATVPFGVGPAAAAGS